MSETAPPRAVVAGWPVGHSRSPIIHGHWLKALGIPGSYARLAVEPGAFAEFAAGIGRDGLVGANVTIPHKGAAFAACDETTAVAKSLGAVNTLWREEGRLFGDNTDVEGFLANLDAEAPDWMERRDAALVLGAGGAARAVVYGLLQRGFGRVLVANRTFSHASDLAAHFGEKVFALRHEPGAEEVARADLFVNATSLGMAGQPALFLDLTQAKPAAVVTDIVYVPLETELILAARRRGLKAVGGLGMLLHQAASGFARWFGQRPVVDAELRALVEADVRRSPP